jgi:hypothetical protein
MTFKDALAAAKGDKYYYDPKSGTHKLKRIQNEKEI